MRASVVEMREMIQRLSDENDEVGMAPQRVALPCVIIVERFFFLVDRS